MFEFVATLVKPLLLLCCVFGIKRNGNSTKITSCMIEIGLWTRLKQRKIGIKRKGIMIVSTFNRKQIIIPKPIMPIIVTETEFQKFRGKLHNQFKHFADSAMELIDALCSNNKTASVVKLSLNPLFRRGHSAIFKAIFDIITV